MIHAETDIVLPTIGPPVTVNRTYFSGPDVPSGHFGPGWLDDYEIQLQTSDTAGDLELVEPGGRKIQLRRGGTATHEGDFPDPLASSTVQTYQGSGEHRLLTARRYEVLLEGQTRTPTSSCGMFGPREI